MNEINLKIEGMMCEGCENRVKNALKELSGVADVSADHTTGKVTVKTNSNNISEIKEKIEELGYEIVKE